nr:unnamed protein product [Callosobruchus analis]
MGIDFRNVLSFFAIFGTTKFSMVSKSGGDIRQNVLKCRLSTPKSLKIYVPL